MHIAIWILLVILLICLFINENWMAFIIILFVSPIIAYLSPKTQEKLISGGRSSAPRYETVYNDKTYINKAYLTYNDLTESAPYRHGFRPEYVGNHFGQRKLLITEIMFLAMKANPKTSYYVIYAGSAPSIKFPVLYELFPNCKFILIDPNNFGKWTIAIKNTSLKSSADLYKEISSSDDRVFIINEIMTVYIAEKLKSLQNTLFISDIRTNLIADAPLEYDILFNSVQQKVWLDILKPLHYMLKFRCPYPLEQTQHYDQFMEIIKDIPEWKAIGAKYLDGKNPLPVRLSGDIYLQCWAGHKSTESRIIGSDPQIIDIDSSEYEGKYYYYNLYLRNHPYSHSLKFKDIIVDQGDIPKKYDLREDLADAYCGCNDCRIEVEWIKKYVDSYETDINSVVELINKYTQSIAEHNIKNTTKGVVFKVNNSKKAYVGESDSE
jgi:hypothetical protein